MDEYIRREDAIKAIGHSDTTQPSYKTEFFTSLKTRTEAMRKVEEIPAADVAPVVHGKWNECAERRPFGKKWMKCSNCKSTNESMIKFNYCPNCGAKMDLR